MVRPPGEGNDVYIEYWGFQRLPFENVPDPRFYFPSSQHEEGLHRMLYAVTQRKGAAMLTGEVGCGKTLLSREFLKQLNGGQEYNVALITNPSFPVLEFLQEILYQFGVGSVPKKKIAILHRLNDHLLENEQKGIASVIVVDEAQAVRDLQILEELRLLLNFQRNDRFLLTLVLLGQPELREKLLEIPQFAQRIGIQYHLTPLELPDVERYVKCRLKAAGGSETLFDADAIYLIHDGSKGIPRVINHLCDLCLLAGAMAKLSGIDGTLVQKATKNSQFAAVS
ncbi:MAG: AAA family ATPase [Nitrospirota bacterium]